MKLATNTNIKLIFNESLSVRAGAFRSTVAMVFLIIISIVPSNHFNTLSKLSPSHKVWQNVWLTTSWSSFSWKFVTDFRHTIVPLVRCSNSLTNKTSTFQHFKCLLLAHCFFSLFTIHIHLRKHSWGKHPQKSYFFTTYFFRKDFFVFHSNRITTARTTVTTMMSIKKFKMFSCRLINWNSILYISYCQKMNTLCRSVRKFVIPLERLGAN